MLEQSFIIALLVLAIWYCYQDGEIFNGIAKVFERNTPKAIHPALFECNICMCFWYGSGLYWLIYGLWLHVAVWQTWLIVVVVAMGINVTINKLSPDK